MTLLDSQVPLFHLWLIMDSPITTKFFYKTTKRVSFHSYSDPQLLLLDSSHSYLSDNFFSKHVSVMHRVFYYSIFHFFAFY